MEELFKKWKRDAVKQEEKSLLYIKALKFEDSKKVDETARSLHDEAFEKIDCLKCGNCCKVSKPLIKEEDIERIAKFLNVSEAEIEQKYLQLDEYGEWTFNKLPCPFLGIDNVCQIYSFRPKDCEEFPHTNKEHFASRSYLHSRNTVVCPVTFYIVQRMKEGIK